MAWESHLSPLSPPERETGVIKIFWIDNVNFRLDWTDEPDLAATECREAVMQQIYAMLMGWA